MKKASWENAFSGSLPPAPERIRLDGGRRRYRLFAAFLICLSLLIATFAVFAVWYSAGGRLPFSHFLFREDAPQDAPFPDRLETPEPDRSSDGVTSEKGVEENRTENLAFLERGRLFFFNETVHTPDAALLLREKLSISTVQDAPTVLIIHSHSSEGYADCVQENLPADRERIAYTREASQNVSAVGEALCKTLNEKGIRTIHCTKQFDTPGLVGAYARSADAVSEYLREYPSIRLVIDLHRDSVTGERGEPIRTLADGLEEPTAQVMAVVGSDGNGTPYPNWQTNLSLALQLRDFLNAEGRSVARPVYLRNASFYQEISPFALILEVGSEANTVSEAERAAVLVGGALADLIRASEAGEASLIK